MRTKAKIEIAYRLYQVIDGKRNCKAFFGKHDEASAMEVYWAFRFAYPNQSYELVYEDETGQDRVL